MNLKECDAIVLKTMKYNDSSKIITVFSDKFGKFNLLAKGIRSSRSSQCGVFEEMNHVKIFLNYKINRDLQVVNKSECIDSFSKIKQSLKKLEFTYRILEILNKLSYEFDSDENLFRLSLYCINLINLGNYKNPVVYLYFLINFLKVSGIDLYFKLESEKLNNNKYNETFDYKVRLNNNKENYRLELDNIMKKGTGDINNYLMSEKDCIDILSFLDIYLHQNFEIKNIFKSKYIFRKINDTI